MLSVYVPRGTSLERIPVEPGQSPAEAAVWIDLVTPTVQEDKTVEALLGTAVPKTTPVTFILSSHRLLTVRYDEPRPFAIVEHKLARSCPVKVSGESVLMDLLDAVIDRTADILERIAAEVDQVSHSIFEPDDEGAAPSYNDVLKALGRK